MRLCEGTTVGLLPLAANVCTQNGTRGTETGTDSDEAPLINPDSFSRPPLTQEPLLTGLYISGRSRESAGDLNSQDSINEEKKTHHVQRGEPLSSLQMQ